MSQDRPAASRKLTAQGSRQRRTVWLMIALVCGLATLNPQASLVMAMLACVYLGASNAINLMPFILIAAGLQVILFVAGVQYGWLVLLACMFSQVVRWIFSRRLPNFNRKFIFLGLCFLALNLFVISAHGGEGRIDRLLAMMVVIFVAAILAHPSTMANLVRYGKGSADALTVNTICIAGLGILIVLLSLFAAGDITTARNDELGLSIGEQSSSPRPFSNVFGMVVVVAVVSAISLGGKFRDTIFWLISASLCAVGMLYTGSRMPMFSAGIAAGAGLLLYFNSQLRLGRFNRRSLFVLVMLSVSTALFFLILNLGPSVLPFVSDSVEDLRVTRGVVVESNVRWQIWDRYVDGLTVAEMLMGNGLGMSGNPHSIYMGTFAAFGIIGVIALAIFLFLSMLEAYKSESYVAIAVLLYTALSLSTSSDIDRPHFWVMACVAFIFLNIKKLTS